MKGGKGGAGSDRIDYDIKRVEEGEGGRGGWEKDGIEYGRISLHGIS